MVARRLGGWQSAIDERCFAHEFIDGDFRLVRKFFFAAQVLNVNRVNLVKQKSPEFCDMTCCIKILVDPLHRMSPFSSYFDPKQAAAFRKALPNLNRQLGKIPFEDRKSTYGVAGETFRAYTGWSNKPSETYRDWAESICNRITVEQLLQHLKARDEFRAWHDKLAKSLQKHWYRIERRRLSYAHLYKLVDLFVKWLSRHQFGNSEITSGFSNFANCALDRQTLKKLNQCLSLALPMPAPSMGHILGPKTYQFSQEAIAAFSLHCGATPLLFDFYAWKRGG